MTEGYSWVSDGNIVGEISNKALAAELGKAAPSAFRKVFWSSETLVPSPEHLEIGDVILSGYPKNSNGRHKWHPVRSGQLRAGCDADCCHWTHAMLYVGDLHVAESNKPIRFRTGVSLAPLTRDAHKCEFLVLRYKDASFLEARHEIVRYALLNTHVAPRGYDLFGAISSAFRWRPTGTDHDSKIFCSEFILECFAISGTYMVQDLVEVKHSPNRFFLPAHLAKDSRFEQIPMKYVRVSHSAHSEPSAEISNRGTA